MDTGPHQNPYDTWSTGWDPQWHAPGYPPQQRPQPAPGPQGPQNPQGPQLPPSPSGQRPWPTAIVAIVALVIAVGAGVGLGHVFWPGAPASAASSDHAASAPTGQNGADQDGTGQNDGQQNGNSGSGETPGNTQNGGRGQQIEPLLPQNLFPGFFPDNPNGSPSQGNSQSSITSAPGAPDDISDIAGKVDDGIVDINATFQYQRALGAGTGIVLTSDGEVLTNNHVIDGATSITATDLGNGKTYQATVVGYDPTGDVAVLQLKDASGLTAATLGDSSSLTVDDPVVGIGNAGGRGGTPSAAGGSVTALNQSISVGDEMYGTTEKLTGLIETNADIQSGDSGGPLVTSSGDVVGMDTAASVGLAATASGHEGYAIPINTAEKIVKAIESGHSTGTIHIGATAALGVLVSTDGAEGARVSGVVADGAAAGAGIVAGDVITSFDGHAIDSAQTLSSLMTNHQPGDSVTVEWTGTDGTSHQATVTLGTGPAA